MSYVIREEGYEYRGFKLGQMVIYKDEIVTRKIIGFDERNECVDYFLLLDRGSDGKGTLRYSLDFITSLLKNTVAHEEDLITWAMAIDVLRVDPSDDQLPQDISTIHAVEIIEDIIKDEFVHEYFMGSDNSELFSCFTQEQMNIMKQCIEVLKGAHNE
jgi:hypothetical protein